MKPCGWDVMAEPGICQYCGKAGEVAPDPFGQQPACLECFELIIGGHPDDNV